MYLTTGHQNTFEIILATLNNIAPTTFKCYYHCNKKQLKRATTCYNSQPFKMEFIIQDTSSSLQNSTHLMLPLDTWTHQDFEWNWGTALPHLTFTTITT